MHLRKIRHSFMVSILELEVSDGFYTCLLEVGLIDWELPTSSLKISTQPNAIRSSGNSSIFDTFQNQTHRTNAEGLVDIYALSRCDFFIHGYSAMAEAAIYLHPALHNQSVNVDYPLDERIPVSTFQQMVTEFYNTTTTANQWLYITNYYANLIKKTPRYNNIRNKLLECITKNYSEQKGNNIASRLLDPILILSISI